MKSVSKEWIFTLYWNCIAEILRQQVYHSNMNIIRIVSQQYLHCEKFITANIYFHNEKCMVEILIWEVYKRNTDKYQNNIDIIKEILTCLKEILTCIKEILIRIKKCWHLSKKYWHVSKQFWHVSNEYWHVSKKYNHYEKYIICYCIRSHLRTTIWTTNSRSIITEQYNCRIYLERKKFLTTLGIESALSWTLLPLLLSIPVSVYPPYMDGDMKH